MTFKECPLHALTLTDTLDLVKVHRWYKNDGRYVIDLSIAQHSEQVSGRHYGVSFYTNVFFRDNNEYFETL